MADQDADPPRPRPAPQREVERHGLEAQPGCDLGGGHPFGGGRLGCEDQRRAEAVGHAVAVLVQEEMAEIEQGGQVERGWGGGWGLGGGGVGQCQQRGEGGEEQRGAEAAGGRDRSRVGWGGGVGGVHEVAVSRRRNVRLGRRC